MVSTNRVSTSTGHLNNLQRRLLFYPTALPDIRLPNMLHKVTGKPFAIALSIAALAFHSQVNAAGFALIEQSASGMGNAFAGGAAASDDASAMYFNPAAMANINRSQVVATGHSVMPEAHFVDGGSHLSSQFNQAKLEGSTQQDGGVSALVPNFYGIVPIRSNLQFGVAVNVPFGLSVKYDDDWIGRYHAVDSELSSLNINPSFAYRISPKLALGMGLSLQKAAVRLSSAVDFGAMFSPAGPSRTKNDGFAVITGDNNGSLGVGWNFGLQLQVNPKTLFGLAYRSSIKQKLKGDVDFSVPASYAALLNGAGTFNDGKVSATVNFPATLSVSAVHRYDDQFSFMADITWTGWSEFDELRIEYDNSDNPSQPDSVTREDWRDSYRYAIGMNYRAYPDWLLRWGFAYDQTPVPNDQRRTPRIPDNDRVWGSFGMSHQLNKQLRWDLGYTHIRVKNTQINNTVDSDIPALQSTLVGSYYGSVDILSFQISWDF